MKAGNDSGVLSVVKLVNWMNYEGQILEEHKKEFSEMIKFSIDINESYGRHLYSLYNDVPAGYISPPNVLKIDDVAEILASGVINDVVAVTMHSAVNRSIDNLDHRSEWNRFINREYCDKDAVLIITDEQFVHGVNTPRYTTNIFMKGYQDDRNKIFSFTSNC